LTTNHLPFRVGWINGPEPKENRLRWRASAAFPLFCALFVLALPAVDSRTFGKDPGAFPNESAAMVLVVAGILMITFSVRSRLPGPNESSGFSGGAAERLPAIRQRRRRSPGGWPGDSVHVLPKASWAIDRRGSSRLYEAFAPAFLDHLIWQLQRGRRR
jgi:hypothetical protein